MSVRRPFDAFGQGAAAASGHRVVVEVEALRNGAVYGPPLPVVDGGVAGDRSRFIRRQGEVVIGSADYFPADPRALATAVLSPYGGELRVWRGIAEPLEQTQWACQGTLVVADLTLNDDGTVRVEGFDRGFLVDGAEFDAPRTEFDTSVIELITDLIAEAVPLAGVLVSPLLVDLPVATITWDRSRSEAISKLCQSIGAEGFFNAYGDFVVQPVPDPGAPAVWTATDATLVSKARSLSRRDVYNGVRVTGSAYDLPAPVTSGLIVDDNPWSPTYWGRVEAAAPGVSLLTGQRFGHVPRRFSSPIIRSEGAAQVAARGMLLESVGLVRSLDLTTLPDPSRQVGDNVAVAGVPYLIDTWDVGLSIDSAMRGSTRTTRYSEVDVA